MNRMLKFSFFALSLMFSGLTLAEPTSDKLYKSPQDDIVLDEARSKEITNGLPPGLKRLLEDEVQLNFFFSDPNIGEYEEFEKLGDFHPKQERWFYLPHIEVPTSEVPKINLSNYVQKETEQLLFFNKGGKQMTRIFLHPFREMGNYDEVIEKYGLRYEFIARPTSSPRSLIVVRESAPEKPSWVKVSLHVKLTELQRRQKLEKMARALAVNNSIASIPERTREQIGFDFLPESAALQVPGKSEVVIHRELPEEWKTMSPTSKQLRATFSLFHPDKNGEVAVEKMIAKSGLDDMAYFREYMIRPVCEVFAYLGFQEGIQPGLHSANYYSYVKNGQLTKDIAIKDHDGSWFDVETRALRQKPFDQIHGFMAEPFKEFLFPSASGRSSSPRQHFGEIYNRYMRNGKGFSSLSWLITNHMTKKYPRRDAETLMREIQNIFDNVMIEEVEKHTGLKLTLADFRSGHLKENGLNKALNHNRNELLSETLRGDSIDEAQDILRDEFIRLRKQKRVWMSQSVNDDNIRTRLSNKKMRFFYDENSGLIQLRSYRYPEGEEFKIYGYAFIEDPDSLKSQQFLKKMKPFISSAPGSSGVRSCVQRLIKVAS